jgi:hypothetical protein
MIFQFLPLKSPSDFRMVIGHLAMGILGPSDFPFFSGIPGLVIWYIAMVSMAHL